MSLNEMLRIGDKLKYLRKLDNLKQKEMADELGIRYTTYSNYENNNRTPSKETLEKIADYFNITVDFFLYDKPLEYSEEFAETYDELFKIDIDSPEGIEKLMIFKSFGDFLRANNIDFYADFKDGTPGKFFSFDGNEKMFLPNIQAEQLPLLIIAQIKAFINSADKLNSEE